MPRAKKPPLGFVETLHKLHQAGLDHSPTPVSPNTEWETLPSLNERIRSIFEITTNNKPTNMLFFVMYDIESNKVRRHVVKYLISQGCHRVQKSIFLANLTSATYDKIRSDLAAVQECYDNNDSILVVPVSTDHLKAMKIIGQNIDIDVITQSKNTLFF